MKAGASTSRARAGAAIAMAAASVGCGALIGLDGFEAVDCVGPCDGGADGRASDGPATDDVGQGDGGPDAAGEGGPPADAAACPDLAMPCATGARLAVTYVGTGGTLDSDPAGIVLTAGQSGSACFGVGGIRLRLSSGNADWEGVPCQDGNTNASRCELSISKPTCVIATGR